MPAWSRAFRLAVPVLLDWGGSASGAVVGLASHKGKRRRELRAAAQDQLVGLVERFTGRPVVWPDDVPMGARGSADLLDALLGLAVGLGLFGALPVGRPPAIYLTHPLGPFVGLPDRYSQVAQPNGWWHYAARPPPGVGDDGIVALKWW